MIYRQHALLLRPILLARRKCGPGICRSDAERCRRCGWLIPEQAGHLCCCLGHQLGVLLQTSNWMKILTAATVYFLVVFATGFVIGPVRVLSSSPASQALSPFCLRPRSL